MIIKQYEAFIRKLKTETRRTSTKDTYKVGKSYAVVPKRAQPTVYYFWPKNGNLYIWHEAATDAGLPKVPTGIDLLTYKPTRALVLSKRWEELHAIDEAGAIAEGIIQHKITNGNTYYSHDLSSVIFDTAVLAYRDLWDLINGKDKVNCWAANPSVCVHKLQLVEVNP